VLSIVRHARTEANAGGRLQGRLDLPLDDVGVQQAALLTKVVHGVDRVVCSPLLRARQTAEVFGIEPTVDERWMEVHYGDLEGCPIVDVPRETWRRMLTESRFCPPGGESLETMSVRVTAAIEDLMEEARTRHVVVVTHATPVKAAMAWALGAPLDTIWRSHVDQASVTRIIIRDRGPALSVFNLVPY
jgi:broad specificity phosphatase PhoE